MQTDFIILVWLSIVCAQAIHVDDQVTDTKEYCTNEKFSPRCNQDEVIIIQSAQYGRLRKGRCISGSYGRGCYADVKTHLEAMCSGQTNCSVLVGTLDSIAQPCDKDLKSYLEASYKCVKVSTSESCLPRTNSTVLNEADGYLLLKPPPSPGRVPCPWRLQTDAGRRFNITRMRLSGDYNLHRPNEDTPPGSGHVCPYVIKISDGSHVITYDPCAYGPGSSGDVVYSSTSSTVGIRVIWRERKSHKGVPNLYHYKVYGCKNLVPPEGAVMTRGEENAKVVCNATQKTWYLTCRDGAWIGEVGNCTNAKDIPQISTLPNPPKTFQNGIMIAVLIGVVLGIVVGAFMLFLIYLLKKGRRRETRAPPSAVESHYDTRLRLGTPNDTSASYPALLCQEKPCGAHTCEYTHVWNMHPSGIEPTYIASTIDRSTCKPPNVATDDRTSTFQCRRPPSEEPPAAPDAERISLDNLRSAATPLVANRGPLEVPPEPFTPAYYELESKLQSNRNLPKVDEFPEFHVVFKNPVDPL